MSNLVILIGVVIGFMGILSLVNPNRMKRCIAFCSQGKRLYGIGVLRICVGIILLLAASQYKFSLFVALVGILAIVSSVLIFSMKLEKTKSILDWWSKRPPLVLRILSIIAIAIGVLLIYSI